MAAGRVLTGIFLIGALAAAPVSAGAAQRQRNRSDQRDQQRDQQREQQRDEQAEAQRSRARAVPRQQYEVRRDDRRNDNNNNWRRNDDNRRNDNNWRRNDVRRYDYPRYSRRTVIVPRVVRPSIVTVVPYRPYVYRPRLNLGYYYGSGGVYPYGYTPRGYYDPIPGRAYGGLRITDAPRDAQVFADGYYVGIVDDFDGVFQHLNLEAGAHHIEVRFGEYDDQAVAFDVFIQPGRTITFRADW